MYRDIHAPQLISATYLQELYTHCLDLHAYTDKHDHDETSTRRYVFTTFVKHVSLTLIKSISIDELAYHESNVYFLSSSAVLRYLSFISLVYSQTWRSSEAPPLEISLIFTSSVIYMHLLHIDPIWICYIQRCDSYKAPPSYYNSSVLMLCCILTCCAFYHCTIHHVAIYIGLLSYVR